MAARLFYDAWKCAIFIRPPGRKELSEEHTSEREKQTPVYAEPGIGSGRTGSNKTSFNARQLPRKKQWISVPTNGENTDRKYSGTLTWMLVKTVLMRLTSEISDASATSFIVQHRSCSCNTIKAGSTKCATGEGRKQSYQRPRFAYHATSMVLHWRLRAVRIRALAM